MRDKIMKDFQRGIPRQPSEIMVSSYGADSQRCKMPYNNNNNNKGRSEKEPDMEPPDRRRCAAH